MKWRKVKKKIKKNIIPNFIGRLMGTDDGLWIRVTNVKISPGGGRKVKYSIIGVSPEFPPVQPIIDKIENDISKESESSIPDASWSCELSKKDSQKLMKLFGF